MRCKSDWFLFFKQKTAYEMRISDWSSDVCSSDLVLVGGIGVMGDGVYGSDPNILDIDNDPEEFIALAGTRGFEAPASITADKITIDGTSLRFSDATYGGLMTGGGASFATLGGSAGSLIAVTGYASENGRAHV